MKHIKTFGGLFESSNDGIFDMDKVERFLAKFPDNATSWSRATEEISDMYVWICDYFKETLERTLPEVGRDNCKTPAQWNQKYKAAIRNGLEELNDVGKDSFYARFKDWFEKTR